MCRLIQSLPIATYTEHMYTKRSSPVCPYQRQEVNDRPGKYQMTREGINPNVFNES